ncbi:MAG: heme A synthase [Nevskiaceae bacterium]|nr:MAG: heme A synthase [Nevskiaceae bacterium]
MLWFRRINSVALALCFAVIVFGAFVRLSDAGLGCPDWPGCYGHLGVPDAPHEVARAEQNFPQRPVEAPKAWKEMIHRYLATTLGSLITLMAVMSLFLRRHGVPRLLPWLLLGTVLMQGALGAFTVLWQVNPLTVTGHLLTGLLTLSLLLLMRLRVAYPRAVADAGTAPEREARNERQAWSRMQETGAASPAVTPAWLPRFAALALALLVFQIFLGGWTSSNYAALGCPDFPTCHGSLLPQTDVKEAFTLWRGLGVNYEGGVLDNRARVTIHYFHRLGALVVTATLLLLGVWLIRTRETLWKRLGIAIHAAVTLQVLIGISVVVLQFPLAVADLHNAGAALLLMVLVTLNFFAWNQRT